MTLSYILCDTVKENINSDAILIIIFDNDSNI